jgi:anti-sigma factor RsiW
MLSHSNRHNQDRLQPTDAMPAPAWPESSLTVVPPPPGTAGGSGGNGGSEACNLVVVNLSAYLDDELDPDMQQVVEAHLRNCSRCTEVVAALQTTDTIIQREWRDNAPLPSSSEFRQAVDNLIDALPPAPVKEAPFARKRVHAKARWMRFSSGIVGVIALFSLLWSTYNLGYTQGRMSPLPAVSPLPAAPSNPRPIVPRLSTVSYRTTSTAVQTPSTLHIAPSPPAPDLSLDFMRSSR